MTLREEITSERNNGNMLINYFVNISSDLNQRITNSLQRSGTVYSLDQWQSMYRLSSGKSHGSNSTMDTESFIG